MTGAGNGIGKSIAKKFSEMDAIVCVTDINVDSAKPPLSVNKSFYLN